MTDLEFVLQMTKPLSPYGIEKIKSLEFFNDKDRLECEFANIKTMLGVDARRLQTQLNKIKNIRGSIKKLGNVLDEVDFFEIKSFLLVLKEILVEYEAMNVKLSHVNFVDMREALKLLDPDGKQLFRFYLSELYSERLNGIRIQKRSIERQMQGLQDERTREQLEAERSKIVADEADEEYNVRKMLSDKLMAYKDDFLANFESLANLDFTIAKATLASHNNCVMPEISEQGVMLEQGINPYVQDTLSKRHKTFTPICIQLDSGASILTGANMGGKSVTLKTIVLNLKLIHMGFFAFASHIKTPLFDSIYLLENDASSVDDGLSRFGAEVCALDEIIQAAKRAKVFIAIDELASGTNPYEGAHIVRAVCKYLNQTDSVSILSTHYDNVADNEICHYQVSGLRNADFGKITSLHDAMDYSLIKVKADCEVPKDALNICKFLGLEQQVIDLIERSYAETEV